MFDRFTDRAKKVMSLARQEALRLGHEDIGTGHLLLGILAEGSGVAATVLRDDTDFERARVAVESALGRGSADSGRGQLPFSARAKQVLELALEEASALRHNYIGTEHLLLGLVREPQGVGGETLRQLGSDLGVLRQRVLDFLGDGPEGSSPTAESPSDRLQDRLLRRLATRWQRRVSKAEPRVLLVLPAGVPAVEPLARQVLEPALRGAIVVEHASGVEGAAPPLAASIQEADLAVVVFVGHDPDAVFALASCLAHACMPVVLAERREQLPTELRGWSWIRWAPGDALDDSLRDQVAAAARPLLGLDRE